jgi:hypothetical protein
MNNMMCPRSGASEHDDEQETERDPEPQVKLGNLSPFFFEEGIVNNSDAETEEDPEPLVQLGNLTPLFLE